MINAGMNSIFANGVINHFVNKIAIKCTLLVSVNFLHIIVVARIRVYAAIFTVGYSWFSCRRLTPANILLLLYYFTYHTMFVELVSNPSKVRKLGNFITIWENFPKLGQSNLDWINHDEADAKC